MNVPPQYPTHYPTRIAFVGEQPGSTDVDKGMPLSGSSGNVFNAMLRTANLDRSSYLITNVFDEPIDFTELDRNDPRFLSAVYRLANELSDASPSVVVPLGPTALWAFTGSKDLASQRGAIQPASYIRQGVKLLPTFHPSFIIKQWKYFSVVTADIIRADREGAFREIRLPRRELLIEPTVREFREYMPRLLASDLLSVDIETGWGMVTNLGFGPDSSHAINLPFVDVRNSNKSFYSVSDEIEIWKMIKEVMESDVPKLGQNFAAYDGHWFVDNMGIAPRNLLHDTRLIHHALYPELPKNLAFMGASYTEQGAWKNWGHKSTEKKDS